MAKFFSLVLAALMMLAPSLAFAGPGGPACDTVAPNWNATTNSSGLWFFNSSTGVSSGADQDNGTTTGTGALPTLINPTFSLLGNDALGHPDLNGDGITDVVMTEPGGFTFGYIMQDNGAGFVSVASMGPLPGLITPDYRYSGLPDLNGDGKTDLCEIHTGGFHYCYLMDGLTVLGMGQVDGPITPDFRIIGYPNMDGANGDDVTIQHTGGFTYTYIIGPDAGTFVQTTAMGATGSLITTDFATIGFPDLNGDNKADIVTQHTGGFTYAFTQDGVTELGQGAIDGLITTDFVTLGFPDMDGDGNADHVMQHTGTFTYAFLEQSDGAGFVQNKGAGQVNGPPDATFVLRGFPDINCDNAADITFQAPGGFTVAYAAGASGFMDTSTQRVLEAAPAGSTTRDWAKGWSVLPDPFAP